MKKLYSKRTLNVNSLSSKKTSLARQRPVRGAGIYDILSAVRRKVFIALRMAGIAGQEKLSGIFRYLGDSPAWDVTLVRTAAELTAARVCAALRDGCDGFVFSLPNAARASAPLAESDVPLVVLDVHDAALVARTRNVVFIRNSGRAIGEAAANHLLSLGICRSYACVDNPSVREWSAERLQTFRDLLRANGLWCHDIGALVELTRLPRPVGVFAANDDRGYEVVEFCRAHRLRVPEDVAVLGTNNDTLICENCHPRLSSVQPDFEQEGYLAAQALDDMMSRRAPASPRLFVGVKTIVRRESTSVVSPAGKLVQKALAYIRKNALRGFAVDDVARHVKVSRRLLDLRFRQLQGTSIGETVVSLRLEEAKRLLRTTHEKLDAIAERCGYTNSNALKNIFKKRFNLSMRDFRRLTLAEDGTAA